MRAIRGIEITEKPFEFREEYRLILKRKGLTKPPAFLEFHLVGVTASPRVFAQRGRIEEPSG